MGRWADGELCKDCGELATSQSYPPPLVSLRKLEMIKTAFGKDRPEIGHFFCQTSQRTHDPAASTYLRYHGLSHGCPLRSTPRANGRLMGRFPRPRGEGNGPGADPPDDRHAHQRLDEEGWP